ncbi:unnamed protein product [Kuraishia capsulata CBS 1993]|uniref:Intimal thickness related receptor IRP domain-containing protein n=1 Tax=Kuraishia capsulata CBS 1993 TaxID=1382522 RepID=W6MKQ7_9ASCO|nr:uncharacterized protein KUCA_T00001306001 [Kuraishia capsulata CBS 1993]CDK25337.1 unnamed protein product [Kuraishia capsulata CBS 1993]
MLTVSRLIAALLAVSSVVRAVEEPYQLKANQKFQTCAVVANYSHWLLLSENLDPFVGVKIVDKEALKGSKRVPPVKEGEDKKEEEKSFEWDLDVVIISAEDLALTKMEPGPAVKVCDESAMKAQLCHFNPSTVPQYPLDQLVGENLNKKPISAFKLSADNHDIFQYPVAFTENYCVIMQFNTAEESRTLELTINWQQSYGQLVQWDYHYMYIYALIGIIYFIAAISYFYYVFFKRRSTTSEYQGVVNSKTQLRNAEIQLRILLYMIGNCLVYFLTSIHLHSLNKIGYVHSNFSEVLLFFSSLASNTVFSVWVLYNLLLLSSGYLFISGKKGGPVLLFIRFLTGFTFISFLVFDVEHSNVYSFLNDKSYTFMGSTIYIEYLISFVTAAYWSFKTYVHLRSNGKTGTANRFFGTMILILLPVLFSELVREIIAFVISSDAFSTIANLSSYSYIFNLVITLVVAFLWRNTLLDSERVGKE